MRRFLVVEDNHALARSIIRVLSSYGTSVHASSLREAYEALLKEDFHAIIVDLGLPDGSGLEALRTFRARHPNRPAMVLTGFSDHDDINAAYDLNAEYVMKPMASSRIHSFVQRSVLARRRVAADRRALSPREIEVIHLAQQGFEDRAIASRLSIATSTVRVLFARATRKLGASSRKDVVDAARCLELI